MSDQPSNEAFREISEAGRVARTARMLDEKHTLQPNQRADIRERLREFQSRTGVTYAQIAAEIGLSQSVVSEVMNDRYKGKTSDAQLVRINNWLELAARRQNLVTNKQFVESSVAIEIMEVASLVAETCKIGVVFGPGQIGKSMTLKAIEGDQRFGAPVLIDVDESCCTSLALAKRLCQRFELKSYGTFEMVAARLVERIKETKRMLIFDEADMLPYRTLEWIRRLHDQTGCPVLLVGKPAIYEKLGFRQMGDFHERLDQLIGRIVVKRDLTERARGKHPQPLFTLEDIRKFIKKADLKLKVAPDAERFLQDRASTLGMGGIGLAISYLYLAAKLVLARGDDAITREHLEEVGDVTMGAEDAAHVAEVVRQAQGMRRVV